MCERRPGQALKLANRAEWVRDIQHEMWFYADGTPNREKRVAVRSGAFITGRVLRLPFPEEKDVMALRASLTHEIASALLTRCSGS